MNEEVTEVRLGGGGRRWWPFAAGGLVVWVVVAMLVGSGGDDEGGRPVVIEEEPTTTTEEGARGPATSRPARSTTTSTAIPGAPLLGRRTGWHVVIPGARPRIIDLDTGETTEGGFQELVASRPDGVFTLSSMDGEGSVVWHPFPFDDATAVPIGGEGPVYPVPGEDLVWVSEGDPYSGATHETRLVSLTDGSVLATVDLPRSSWPLGLAGASLVVDAGGDTFVVGPTESVRRYDGRTDAIVDGDLLMTTCDDELRCGAELVDLDTDTRRRAPELDGMSLYQPSFAPPGALLVIGVTDSASDEQPVPLLVDEAGARPAVPDDIGSVDPWSLSWSPDGELLVLPDGGDLVFVDPFAEGGPVTVASFPMRWDSYPPVVVVAAGST